MSNVLRSSAFLTLYTITQYWGVMLFTSTISPNITRLQWMSFGWLSGLWTLLERKERRPELATYCGAHAINALYNIAKKNGYITHTPKIVSYFLLALGSAINTHYYHQHPKFVRDVFGFDEDQQDQKEII